MSFKKGDKVLCIDCQDQDVISWGKTYLVENCVSNVVTLKDIPLKRFMADRFKMLEPSAEVTKEMVNSPAHYKGNKFEAIEIIEDYNLGFCLGNAVKYILRAGKKDATTQELEKAIWYLKRHIQSIQNENKNI